MSAKKFFAPVPLRSMADDLSGLLLRILICVAAHDRMSLLRQSGNGCTAANARMAALVGCNYSRLCAGLSELVERGYLAREQAGRVTVYRVVYNDDDQLLFGNVSAPGKGCRTASASREIGCRDLPENGRNLPKTDSQYIPLNGGIDSAEAGEINSTEVAHLSAREAQQERSGANLGGDLAKLERDFRSGRIEVPDLRSAATFLGELLDRYGDPDVLYRRAERLEGDISGYLQDIDNARAVAQ